MSLNIKFTDAGKAALVNPANIGTEALNITAIELGAATYNPTGSEINLQSYIKSLPTFGADTVADDVIHVTIRDDSSDTYNLGEIGLRSGTGILMGVISTAGEIITQKGPNDVLLLSADASITEVDITNLTFGDAEFIYSPATPTRAGILEVANQTEVDGAAQNMAVDPYQLQALLTRRLTSSLTDPSTSQFAAAKAVYDLNVAINNINTLIQSDTATLDTLQEIVDYIKLNRSDLDSLGIASIAGLQTVLDGKSGTSHSHAWSAITSKPSTFTPSSHSHAWSGITSKPSTFPPSSHSHAISNITGLQDALDSASSTSNITQVWTGSAWNTDLDSISNIPDNCFLFVESSNGSFVIYRNKNNTTRNVVGITDSSGVVFFYALTISIANVLSLARYSQLDDAGLQGNTNFTSISVIG